MGEAERVARDEPQHDTSRGLPQRTLTPRAAMAIAVGIVVGAGIFRTPSLVAGASASEAAMLGAWVLGGLISIIGALCYAELASAYPSAGGDYDFLRRAYGGRVAFLYAWARLAIIQTGSLALLAFVVGDYANELLGLGPRGPAIYAALAVAGVTLLNWLGVREGTTAQSWLTVAEVLGLLVIVVAGLLLAPEPVASTPPASETAFGLVMVFVLLTFGGWNEAVYVSGELKDAPRHMARVLVLSLLAVTLLYVAVNAAYVAALGLGGMAASQAVAADAMRTVAGEPGAVFISLLVLLAALSSANATAFTGGRTNYALGRDVPALGFLGRWDVRRGTPGNALLVQGAAALLLVLGGAFARDGFQLAVEYSAPVFWLFFLAVGVALFVLRVRDPARPRPFKVPLYPVLPAIFCTTNAWLLYSSLAYTGRGALVGVAVLVAGALLLLYLRPRPRQATEIER